MLKNSNNTPAANQTATNQHLGANLRNMLQKSGYTDIRVAPTSFMVHAKDSAGNLVTMSVSPDFFAEVTDTQYFQQWINHRRRTPANNVSGSGRFVSISGNDDLSSKVVGLETKNGNKQDVGQIKEHRPERERTYPEPIFSRLAGFLGMGEHYVAVKSLHR